MKHRMVGLWMAWAAVMIVSAGWSAQDSDSGWATDCSTLAGWFSNTEDPSFQTALEQPEKSVIKVTQQGPDAWGKAACSVRGVDLDKTPVIEVKVNKVDKGSAFQVAVASPDWKEMYVVVPRSSADGLFKGDIRAASKWSGVADFNVVVIVEGKGKSAYIDEIKILSKAGSPVPEKQSRLN